MSEMNGTASGEINTEYMERLKGLPTSLLDNERKQLDSSMDAVSSAINALGKRHSAAFVGAPGILAEVVSLVGELDAEADTALRQSRHIPAPNPAVYRRIAAVTESDLYLYAQIEKVQELLQIPDLVKSCVDSGYCSAALDLAGFLARLNGRYPNNAAIRDITAQVDGYIGAMVAKIVRLFRESARMPTLIKMMAVLRRTAPFKTSPTVGRDLQQLFLASRLEFLRGQLKSLDVVKSNPFGYLKHVVESAREHVFATATAFVTMFSEESDLLADFVRAGISLLHDELVQHAPSITDKYERDSLWLQLAYCSKSLGRVGVEFWPFMSEGALSHEEWLAAFHNQMDLAKAAVLKVQSKPVAI